MEHLFLQIDCECANVHIISAINVEHHPPQKLISVVVESPYLHNKADFCKFLYYVVPCYKDQ